MAQISINDEIIVNGKITVQRTLDENGDISIFGSFATHLYIEEISKLETFRYSISGIEVREEIFGSDDFDIVYNFTAESIHNKYGYSNLQPEDIERIEGKIYDKAGYLISSNLSAEVSIENE